MSRYADDSNATANRASAYEAEAPLPTYEEIVGNETMAHHFHGGFKTDVLLPASSSDQGQSSVDAPNRENEGAPRTSSCKPNRTGAILVLLCMILIPMCGMIIILQVKVCSAEHSELQQSLDKINASYSDCTAELSSLQDTLASNENLIRDLNYQVEQLNSQKLKLQRMLNSIEE